MAVVRPLILNLTVQKYYFYFIYANFFAFFLHFLKILHTFHNKIHKKSSRFLCHSFRTPPFVGVCYRLTDLGVVRVTAAGVATAGAALVV